MTALGASIGVRRAIDAMAGITVAVAAAMTGADLARIEQLPDPSGMRHEVAIQTAIWSATARRSSRRSGWPAPGSCP
jgi:hypothetical protein